ncbi:MAG: NAD-dependent epimerase/dehydratase family protein [Nitrososphaerota archaeon]
MEGPVLLTGGAGFLGSHILDRLLNQKVETVILDNFSSGQWENIAPHRGSRLLKIVKGDIRDREAVNKALQRCRTIIHLAANPEVRMGDPEEHLEHNVRGTLNILEAARRHDISLIAFASSSTVYGEAKTLPTPEDYTPMEPISTYGASKLACEALLSAYGHTYNLPAVAMRYANIVGPRARRGVVYDFTRKLMANPHRLEILGDGTQRKSYIWVGDAVEATLTSIEKRVSAFEAYNVGSADAITVREVADTVCEALNLKGVEYVFTGGPGGRGWLGDVKSMHLDIRKLMGLGWRPRYNSREAVALAAREVKRELSKGQ